jgi:hypothetical protein
MRRTTTKALCYADPAEAFFKRTQARGSMLRA